MHNLGKYSNRAKRGYFFKRSRKALFFGKEVKIMEERKAEIIVDGQEPQPVVIIDNGEDFENGDGRTPNHDKIEIVYINNK
jgi:hypothetical protein